MAAEVINALLERGLEDWIQLAEVVSLVMASSEALDDAFVKDATLDIIRGAVEGGLVQVGDLTETGFVPWALGPREALERLRQRWDELSESPGLGEVCWLANTPAGDAQARGLNMPYTTADPPH